MLFDELGSPLGGRSTPSPHTIRPAAESVEASSPLLWRTSKDEPFG